MSRRDNISANVARLLAATVIHHGVLKSDLAESGIAGALSVATAIEDAVEAAENARQDALNKANEAKRAEATQAMRSL